MSIGQQRTPYELRQATMDDLAKWMVDTAPYGRPLLPNQSIPWKRPSLSKRIKIRIGAIGFELWWRIGDRFGWTPNDDLDDMGFGGSD